MKRHACCLEVIVAALVIWVGALNAAEPERLADEQLVRSAGLSADGPALLDLFRKRAAAPAGSEQIRGLVARLADESPAKRDQAGAELIALGMSAVPYLREASRNVDDRALVARARRCLDFIDGPTSVPLMLSATRLLAHHRPAGAVEALVQFLPLAENDAVLDQMRGALLELALAEQAKPPPALLAALDDKLSVRRAVAAEVLAQLGPHRPQARLRKLLKDPSASVRLRVALALDQDEESIVELIQLLGELPAPQAKLAEAHLLDLARELAPAAPLGNDEASRQKAREAWAAWWKTSAGDGALEELRKRTLPDADRDKVLALIHKLGDDSFEEREKATMALSAGSGKIVPLLRQALASSDPEVRNRAASCLQALESARDRLPPLSPVLPRLVGLRKPAGAVEALLGFLATVDDEPALEEVRSALAALAVRDGKADPVLVKSLEDRNPRRRAAAAAALGRGGATEHFPALRRLLHDADRLVRLETALGLAGAREKEFVPVLIGLLAEVPPQQFQRIQDYLLVIAGDKGPMIAAGNDEKERKQCSAAWAVWWKDNEKTITLAALTRQSAGGLLGCTLVVLPALGQVLEVGIDGKVRWQINGVINPMTAQALPGNRVLITETGAGRVSERDTRGNVLWEKRIQSPVGSQRLPNGNTFIVTPNSLVEVDRTGKEVLNRPSNGLYYLGAWKMPTDQIVCVTAQLSCLVLDATGKEIRTFRIAGVNTFNCLHVLANGQILLAQTAAGKVVAYDLEGKVVWEAAVPQPTHAFRLPNGNTLVSTQNPGKVLEIDRTGKQVWEYLAPNQQRVGDVKRR